MSRTGRDGYDRLRGGRQFGEGMDDLGDRLEEWVRANPWDWALAGSLVIGAIALSLQLFVDGHSLGEALPTCGALMVIWFLLLGFSARRRARGALR